MNLLIFLGAFISILIGVLLLLYFVKNPIDKERDTNKHMLQGYISAFGFIILGVILILKEIEKM